MRKGAVPAALFIGLVVSFAGTFAAACADIAFARLDSDVDVVIRWLTFEYGTTVAGSLMVAIALFGVTDRLLGLSRTMMQIAAWVFAGVAAWYVVQPLLAGLWPSGDVYEKTECVYRAVGGAALIGLIVLSIAGRAWTRPGAVTVLAVLGILAHVCGTWTPILGPWIADHVYGGTGIARLFWVARELAVSVGVIAMVYGALAEAPEASTDPRRAATGFRIASRALLLRVLAEIALAVLGVRMLTSLDGLKLVLFIAPAIGVVSALVFGWGLLVVDRANLPQLPRVRLLVGVGIVTWAAGVAVYQMGDVFHEDGIAPWAILAPLIAVVGMAVIVSAIYSFAVRRGDARLRSMVANRATLFFTLTLVSAVIPAVIGGLMHAPSSMVVLLVLAVVCGVIAVVSLAGMMALVGDALAQAPQLPEARLRS